MVNTVSVLYSIGIYTNEGCHAFAASVRTILPSKPPRKHETVATTHAFAGLGADEILGLARESMAPPIL
jgi:hypothetical protein